MGWRKRIFSKTISILGVLFSAILLVSGGEATSGSLVPSFGDNGVVTSNPSPRWDQPFAIAIDSNFMYVVGSDSVPSDANKQWRIEKRCLTTGSPITSFGTNGVVTSNPSSYDDEPFAIAIDSEYMYVVGYDGIPTDRSQWRIEKRRLSDGSLITTFGENGVVTPDWREDAEIAYGIAIDTNYMYVVGYAGGGMGGGYRVYIEKRRLSDGSLVTTFGENGSVTIDRSSGGNDVECAFGVAIDGTYMYVVGYNSTIRSGFVAKIHLTSGLNDTTFGLNGLAWIGGAGSLITRGIAIDSTHMYLISENNLGVGDTQWLIEKRRLSDGRLESTFGRSGGVLSNPSRRLDGPSAIAIDSNFMYVAGYDSDTPITDGQWRIEKRCLTTGSLITSFGTNGVVTTDPGPQFDVAQAIAIGSNCIYVVGHEASSDGNDRRWRIEKRTR